MSTQATFREALSDFAAVARDFCSRIEEFRSLEVLDLWQLLDEMLPLVYYHGGALATIAPPDLFGRVTDPETSRGANQTASVWPDRDLDDALAEGEDDDACAELRLGLAQKFADLDIFYYMEYWGITSGEPDYDVVEATYSGAVGDLYHNLVHTIDIYKSDPKAWEDCGRTWIEGFSGIWGPRILYVLIGTFRELYGTLTEEEAEAGP